MLAGVTRHIFMLTMMSKTPSLVGPVRADQGADDGACRRSRIGEAVSLRRWGAG